MLETREVRYISPGVKASITTDVGCVREANEDRGLHIKPSDFELQTRRGTLTVVADGMGGHASGEVASQMAIEIIGAQYYADLENDAATSLENAIQDANYQIFEASISDEMYYGMGTTIIALVLLDKIGFVAHVGDSRLYRLREGQLKQMTMDHSQVMEMFKQGIISWEETKNHDEKNVILRAVGTQKTVEVEVSAGFEIKPNDQFLLCSDGLCDMVEADEINQIWSRARDLHEACQNLVQRAKDNGGHDNITVAVVRVPGENEAIVSRNIPITREIGV